MKRVVLILLIAVIVKLAYLLFAWSLGYPPNLDVFKNNDSYWYETVALNGHAKITPDQLGSCEEDELKQSYYAFFPLYPLIVGVSMKVTGIAFTKVAFLYSIIFSLLLFFLSYKFVHQFSQSEGIAFNSTLILILFPFHYYFSVYYTESLFLLLLLAAFYCIELRKLALFSIVSSLLVLVRPNGLFMLLPLFLFFTERYPEFNLREILKLRFKQYYNLLYFAIPVLVFILYCYYLLVMTGDFFAYKTAQAGWCRETVFPWTPILRSSNWMEYFNSGYLLFFIAVAVLFFKKIPLSFSALIWINLILPLTANSITSPRFISVIFVFSLIFGKVIYKLNPTGRLIIFVIFFLLQLLTFRFWLSSSVFSY